MADAETNSATDATTESANDNISNEPLENPQAEEQAVNVTQDDESSHGSDEPTNEASPSTAPSQTAAVAEPVTAMVTVTDNRASKPNINETQQPKQETETETQKPNKQPDEVSKEKLVNANGGGGFGKDFNWEMLEENQKLKQQNKEMVESVKHKEAEIVNLEEALTTLHEELKFLESQEVQSVAKDLAKKNRRLTVQLERERTRSAQLRIETDKLKSKLADYSHHHLSPKKRVEPLSFSERTTIEVDAAVHANDDEEAAAETADAPTGGDTSNQHEEQIKSLTQKLLSAQNESMKQKDLVKKLKSALKKELGLEDSTEVSMTKINEILRDGGSWKGRAEKIAILRTKLKETKRELELLSNDNDDERHGQEQVDKNEEYKQQISEMAAQRVKQYENAQLEVEKVRKMNEELRQMMKAKNCRITGIEADCSSMRKKLAFFVEKSKTDDSLIEKLQNELSRQLMLESSLSKKQKLLNANSSRMHELSTTVKQQEQKISVLSGSIEEMKEKILRLNEEKTEKYRAMFAKFDSDDKLYQIQVLQSENEKQKEMIDCYQKSLTNLQQRLSRKASPRMTDSHGSRQASGGKSAAHFKEKLQAMQQEQQLIKASYLSIIEGKEQEIAICRDMLKQQTALHENVSNALQKQMQEIKQQLTA